MKKTGDQQRAFCRAYLQTMDPDRAAMECGCRDGFTALETKSVRDRLEKMREAAAGQIRREDALRRLAQLAFGRANDAAALAFNGAGRPLEELDLSAVSEIRVTDKGGVEVRFVDRVRALEALCGLLEDGGGQGAEELIRALEGPDDEADHDAGAL